MSDSLPPCGLQPARLLHLWDSPGNNTRVGCHFLLQAIFLTQTSNLRLFCLLHWQVGSLPLETPLWKYPHGNNFCWILFFGGGEVMLSLPVFQMVLILWIYWLVEQRRLVINQAEFQGNCPHKHPMSEERRKLAIHTEGSHCQQNTDKRFLLYVHWEFLHRITHSLRYSYLREMKNSCVSAIKVLSPSRLHFALCNIWISCYLKVNFSTRWEIRHRHMQFTKSEGTLNPCAWEVRKAVKGFIEESAQLINDNIYL